LGLLIATIQHETQKKKTIGMELVLSVEFDSEFKDELLTTIQAGKIPFDYYKMTWKTFRDSPYKIQKKPLRVLSIDNASSSASSAYDYYNKSLYLNNNDKKDIMSHKDKFRDAMKQSFSSLEMTGIGQDRKFGLSQRKLIIENILTIFEKDISIENMGKGKENIIKIETSLSKDSNKSDVILIEEPENHLSHMNLRHIIEYINQFTKCQKHSFQLTSILTKYILTKCKISQAKDLKFFQVS